MGSASIGFSYDASWRMNGGGSWSLSWTNNTGSPVFVNYLSVMMGTGSGGYVWGSNGQVGPFNGSAVSVTGSMSPANGAGSVSVSVGAAVSVAYSGSSSYDTGYFNMVSHTYSWNFSPSSPLANGSTVTFYLSVSSSGRVASVRKTHSATVGYTPSSHTVRFVDGLTGGTISTQSVSYGGSASLPGAPGHTGYTFSGWSGSYTNVTSDRTITANYYLTSYTIIFNGQGGSTSPTSMTVHYNTALGSIASASRTAYNFVGWFTGPGGSGSQYTAYTIYPYASNLTLYACWTPITYSITYLAGDNARSPAVMPWNPSTYNVITGTFTLNNPTRIGYTFIGWTWNGGGTPSTYMQVPYGTYGNLTFVANWWGQIQQVVNGSWNRNSVTYHFDGSNWLAIDTKRFNGSSWNKLP